ncbi:MAG: hypothetical protein WDO24_27110 [Pseudomonadota bacterium]
MMLAGHAMGFGRTAAALAAVLSERDLVKARPGARDADLRVRLELLDGAESAIAASARRPRDRARRAAARPARRRANGSASSATRPSRSRRRAPGCWSRWPIRTASPSAAPAPHQTAMGGNSC